MHNSWCYQRPQMLLCELLTFSYILLPGRLYMNMDTFVKKKKRTWKWRGKNHGNILQSSLFLI